MGLFILMVALTIVPAFLSKTLPVSFCPFPTGSTVPLPISAPCQVSVLVCACLQRVCVRLLLSGYTRDGGVIMRYDPRPG